MSLHAFDAENGLYFEHHAPGRDGAPTFVFVNALTGNVGHWEGVIAPGLRAAGFGSLVYNFRGQENSPFSAGLELTPSLIVDDLKALLAAEAPKKPVLVGLSIGGLFAAQAHLGGAAASGLVLLNTLREIGPRLAWVNDAMGLLPQYGGVQLFTDALFPLLVNEAFAETARPNFLKGGYQQPAAGDGHVNLMRNGGAADWALPYNQLALPTLVVSGTQDRVFYDAQVVDRLFDDLPNARHVRWTDAGHLLPLERPERLCEELKAFGATLEA